MCKWSGFVFPHIYIYIYIKDYSKFRCCLNLWLPLVLCHSTHMPPYSPYWAWWLSTGTSDNGAFLNFPSLHVEHHASQTMSYGHTNSIRDQITTNSGMGFAIDKRKRGKKEKERKMIILAIACHVASLQVLIWCGLGRQMWYTCILYEKYSIVFGVFGVFEHLVHVMFGGTY